ncbi:MAG: hypothetical protein U0231_09015 [Nitrospiraceae bacterium]
MLVREVGLDPVAFEAGLASAKPAKAFEGWAALGRAHQVTADPTILLDGNIKVEQIDPDNLKLIIQSILDGDGTKNSRSI